ncbi:MAG: nucleotidyltransferase domain-containing protein [Oscillospiraceae bacterium]
MYTIEEIKQKIIPIAKAYNLKAVWLFGSYARGEATESSDIDLLFDREGSDITTLVKMSSMYLDIKELFNVSVDLVSANALKNPRNQKTASKFMKSIEKDRVKLYDRT